MYADYTLKAYLDETASKAPVPGGGSIAASSAATGAALVEMVAGLTIGKKKYVDVQEEMEAIIPKAKALRDSLLADIDRDATSFEKVMAAFKMPKESDEEKKLRRKAIEEATKGAAQVPLEVAQKALEVIYLSHKVVEKGNRNAITDGGVACMHGRTALQSALYNVKINLLGLSDEDFIAEMQEKIMELEKKALEEEKVILEIVEQELSH